jgi:hypothetical protein
VASPAEIIRPRSALGERRANHPQFGASYPVKWNNVTEDFFCNVNTEWAKLLPKIQIQDKDDNTRMHYQKLFRLDRPKTLTVSVVDRRPVIGYALQMHMKWNKNDTGRIWTELMGNLGRFGLLDERPVSTFSHAIRVSDADRRTGGRRIAVIPDQASSQAELMLEAHRLIIEGMGFDPQDFQRRTGDFLPSCSVGTIYREAEPDQINACVSAVEELLPLHHVQLGALSIFPEPQFG